MAEAAVPNLFDVPPSALRSSTLAALSTMLNPPKIIPSDDGLPRDWRGLAHLMEVPRYLLPHPSHCDPTGELLKRWSGGSLGLLLELLGRIDRWDVVDDSHGMMEADAVVYFESKERAASSATALSADVESQILTRDDVLRLQQGLPPQRYSAFLLYAEPDEDFALRIITEMEQKYDLKLCVRDRDLVGGHMFQHEAIMRLISERCNRLIVIISENFLRSEANKFFCTFAQALGIEQKRRKVIPVMHEPCRLPPELNYFFVLKYSRSGHLWDFWKKLRDSIEAPVAREESELRSTVSVEALRLEAAAPEVSRAAQEKDHEGHSNLQDNSTLHTDKSLAQAAPELREGSSVRKGPPSMSLENLKARSKQWFSSFPQRSKKKKKKKKTPEAIAC